MPSKQSEAVRRHWEAARLATAPDGAEGPDDESWGDLTAEPRGVDYLETEAGGRPAMWAVPKDSRPDRVLLCLHGGGFVGGSVYTHRKMFGHLAKAAGVRALLTGYRLLPAGGGYPVPVDEGEAAYRWLLGQGIAAEHIAFAGDSVGGRPRRCCSRRSLTSKPAASPTRPARIPCSPGSSAVLWPSVSWAEWPGCAIRRSTCCTPIWTGSARSTSRPTGTRRCSTTPAALRSTPGRPASTS